MRLLSAFFFGLLSLSTLLVLTVRCDSQVEDEKILTDSDVKADGEERPHDPQHGADMNFDDLDWSKLSELFGDYNFDAEDSPFNFKEDANLKEESHEDDDYGLADENDSFIEDSVEDHAAEI